MIWKYSKLFLRWKEKSGLSRCKIVLYKSRIPLRKVFKMPELRGFCTKINEIKKIVHIAHMGVRKSVIK